MSTSFIVPWPPSVNHYYKRGRNGQVFIGVPGILYRKKVGLVVKDYVESAIATPLSLSLILYPPDRRRRDIDNILKALLDAMQHAGVYKDDNLIKGLCLEMMDREEGPGEVHVRIEARE